MAAGMTEAASAAGRSGEIPNNLKLDLHDRNDDELRDALARPDDEGLATAVPAGHHELPLVIGIDQSNQVAQHDAMPVAEARARQNDSGETGVLDMDRKAGWNQLRAAGLQHEVPLETGP